MSTVTKHYCDICKKECLPELSLEGPMSTDGYSTGIHVVVTGRRHQPLDSCTKCQKEAIKRLYKAFITKEES